MINPDSNPWFRSESEILVMPGYLHNRQGFTRFASLAMFLGCAALVGSAQFPPEVEDPKGGVKKRIVVDDEPAGVGTAPVGNPPDVKLDELVRAGAEAKSPELRTLFAKYAVPSDRVNEVSGGTRVKPIPMRKSEWPKDATTIPVTVLDNSGNPRGSRDVPVANIRSVDHFESLVLADVDALLKQQADPTSAMENKAAAEKLLAGALRYHDYARERKLRHGKTWDEIRDPVAARLRDIRLQMLREAITANDPARIREASTRLMNAYPKDPAVAKEVAVARVGEADRLLKSPSVADHIRARELLDELEARFPGAGGDAVKQLRAQLRDMATKAFVRAKDKKGVGDLATARDELARAAALDPSIEGVRELQRELRVGYPILYVGVRQYPLNMSPAAARVDSEKQVVELLFEGLLEEVPDSNGAVRYRTGAALGLPAPVPAGREFQLRSFDRDSAGRPGFDSQDVVGTLKLLATRPDSWQAYPLPWLGALPTPNEPGAVRIPFTLGHPDPRALLTFKMLPARWMTENNKQVDDPGFAEKPFGTGPFKLYSNSQSGGKGLREMVFIDNVAYGRWKDRTGLPNLREIRLVELGKSDPVEAFRTDKLHILTDVPTGELSKYDGPSSALGGRVQVVKKSVINRRVHILAVNLRRPYLQSRQLRQGLSLAIDREEILRDVFRAGRPDFHTAMFGPFPPNSWANPRRPSPLLNRDLAVDRLKKYLSGTSPKLDFELLYPEDDPKAEEACRRIKAHIEAMGRDGPNGRKLVVNLDGKPLRDVINRVENEHRYDLAYVPFDYPDEWHPFGLAAALDPQAGGRGGRNWFGFLLQETAPQAEDIQLGQSLNELRGYRDVLGQLVPRAVEVTRLFNDSVPFVPLWQLDRHMVVHRNLKVFVDDTNTPASPELLNPTTLFQNVARWRLD
jgi:ABC-type oligopeptide transport system substrate-binding subunit